MSAREIDPDCTVNEQSQSFEELRTQTKKVVEEHKKAVDERDAQIGALRAEAQRRSEAREQTREVGVQVGSDDGAVAAYDVASSDEEFELLEVEASLAVIKRESV